MTKISEAISYYKQATPKTVFDSYFKDFSASAKIQTLTLIQEAIGDVDLTEDYLKAYLFGFKTFPFKTPYERMLEKVRIIYEISKDAEMAVDELLTLIKLYHAGSYRLMIDKIKELVSDHQDIESGLKLIISEAREYGLDEAKKLESLKTEYSKEFIEGIQQAVREECISSDMVLEILPTKGFIDASSVEVPGLGYKIKSAEDLVLRRLRFIRVEDDFLKTSVGEKIALGYSSTGDVVYTSFTKGEYEDDLKSPRKKLRKK